MAADVPNMSELAAASNENTTADYEDCADYTNLNQQSMTENHVYSQPDCKISRYWPRRSSYVIDTNMYVYIAKWWKKGLFDS